MNLVFFDIECASVYKYTAKICAFGYVVCDEHFNISVKEDILINPHGKFHLTDGSGEHGLVLPYEYSDFKNYPDFASVYPKIRTLLEDKNNLVFGHATYNDVNYLNLETKRYHVPYLNYSFSDSQLMYMTAINDFSRQFGLEYITKNLNVEFTPHRAADDAYATMMVVEALCNKYNCSGSEIGKVLGIKPGKTFKGEIHRPDSFKYAEYRRAHAAEKKAHSKRIQKFYAATNRKYRVSSEKFKGVTFTFSRELEDDIGRSIPFVEKIYKNGGKYTSKLASCSVYVCEDGDSSVRTKNAMDAEWVKIISDLNLAELLND